MMFWQTFPVYILYTDSIFYCYSSLKVLTLVPNLLPFGPFNTLLAHYLATLVVFVRLYKYSWSIMLALYDQFIALFFLNIVSAFHIEEEPLMSYFCDHRDIPFY